MHKKMLLTRTISTLSIMALLIGALLTTALPVTAAASLSNWQKYGEGDFVLNQDGSIGCSRETTSHVRYTQALDIQDFSIEFSIEQYNDGTAGWLGFVLTDKPIPNQFDVSQNIHNARALLTCVRKGSDGNSYILFYGSTNYGTTYDKTIAQVSLGIVPEGTAHMLRYKLVNGSLLVYFDNILKQTITWVNEVFGGNEAYLGFRWANGAPTAWIIRKMNGYRADTYDTSMRNFLPDWITNKVGDDSIVKADAEDKGVMYTGRFGYMYYNRALDLTDLTIQIRTNQNLSGSPWFGIALLENPTFFTAGSGNVSKGLATLIRPVNPTNTSCTLNRLTEGNWRPDGFDEKGFDHAAFAQGVSHTIRFRRNATTGAITVTLDDKVVKEDCTRAADYFTDNKAYISFGCDAARPVYTIEKINGIDATMYDASITSATYDVSGGYVSGIDTGTTVAELLAGLNPQGGVKVFSGDTEVQGSSLLCTGMTAKLMNNGIEMDTVIIAVAGDTDGDGKITIIDLLDVQAHLFGNALTGAALTAADIDGDSDVDADDLNMVKAVLLKT